MIKEDYFRNLPSEIIIDILSRLPIRTIIMCKVVCKSWCNFITSLEFAKSHLSRSVPGLAVSPKQGEHDPCYEVFGFESNTACFYGIFNFKFPHPVEIRCSFDGMLVMGDSSGTSQYICNPVTCEYIKLPPSRSGRNMIIGFGVSNVTRQYKLVSIAPGIRSPNCEVYTLGTGSWRSIAVDSAVKYHLSYYECAFHKGILHWMAFDSKDQLKISCFDLETELFSTFHVPQCLSTSYAASLTTLRDCLCLWEIYYSPRGDRETSIWSMKQYGDDRVWTKEFVIKNCTTKVPFVITDFNVLIDGDILMAGKWGPELVRFSLKTNTILGFRRDTKVAYTPSFLPVLKPS